MSEPVITVVNFRSSPVDAIYIGRAMPRMGLKGSPLGNPYRIRRGYDIATDPDGKLVAYRLWLEELLGNPSSPQSKEIARLVALAKQGPVALECWCAPARCHGDIVREIVLARWAKGVCEQ
jgi:hypothetical protein